MTAKTKQTKSRKRYPQRYKDEALALAERIGIGSAAKQLGIHEAQLYSCRNKARLDQESWPDKFEQAVKWKICYQ